MSDYFWGTFKPLSYFAVIKHSKQQFTYKKANV